jgi:nicotinamide-nucleotide amidase
VSKAEALLEAARTGGFLIATAESCTGGLLSADLTEVPGSSDVFDRGFVTYSYPAKKDLLGVRQATLDAAGAVSEDVAREMADGALSHSDAHIAVSITGVAGPGASESKPEGMVCFGLALRGQPTRTETRQFGALGRDKVREASVDHALSLLYSALT